MKVEDDRNFFHCEYCGGYDFPNPNQDGVALLDEVAPYSCPICSKPLVIAAIENIRIFSCPICRGNLISQSKMLPILRQARVPDRINEDPQRRPNRSELERKAICPVCQDAMDTYQYGGAGNIIIEGCSHCEMIWLDFGEISRVVHAYSQMYQRQPDEPGQKTQSIKF